MSREQRGLKEVLALELSVLRQVHSSSAIFSSVLRQSCEILTLATLSDCIRPFLLILRETLFLGVLEKRDDQSGSAESHCYEILTFFDSCSATGGFVRIVQVLR